MVATPTAPTAAQVNVTRAQSPKNIPRGYTHAQDLSAANTTIGTAFVAGACDAILFSITGTVDVTLANGTFMTVASATTGVVLPISFTAINTNTAAVGIYALWA